MSSHSKRRAESEEIVHKKKPRKAEDDEFNQDENDVDELGALDENNIISSGKRTRGKRVDYTEIPDKVDLGNDNGPQPEGEEPKVKKGVSEEPRTKSPQRIPVDIEEEDEDEEDEEEDYGDEEEYNDDDGGDEDNEEDVADHEDEEEEE